MTNPVQYNTFVLPVCDIHAVIAVYTLYTCLTGAPTRSGAIVAAGVNFCEAEWACIKYCVELF